MLKMLDHLSVNLSQSRIALDNLLGWSKSVVKTSNQKIAALI